MQITLDRQVYVGLLATSQGEVVRGRTKVDKQGEYASTYSLRLVGADVYKSDVELALRLREARYPGLYNNDYGGVTLTIVRVLVPSQ